jgi:hypothetical protein
MAARAANILIIGTRGSDGQIANKVSVGDDDAPFVSGQNVAILHGLDGGEDLVIHNNRASTGGGQAFSSVVRLNMLDGTSVAMNIVDSAGNPVSFPAGVGYYDFAWDEATQTLCILDFAARDVYVLRPFSDPSCPCDSPANLNCDNVLNFFDIAAYIQNYNAQDPSADLAAPFGTFNFFDIAAYVSLFNAGCP